MSTHPRSLRSAAFPFFVAASLALTFAAGCRGEDDDSGSAGEEAGGPFTGVMRVEQGPDVFVYAHFEGGIGRLSKFVSPNYGNPGTFDAGDALVAELQEIEEGRWTARVALLQVDRSPQWMDRWVGGVEHRETEFVFDEEAGAWVSTDLDITLTPQTFSTFDGNYPKTGACERNFVNGEGHQLYLCNFPSSEASCSTSGEKHFWPSASCADLGYDWLHDEGFGGMHWMDDPASNVTPGEHGWWGDRTGGATTGGGAGGGGGGGGKGCTESYEGPEFDIQMDAFCKAAWNYRCHDLDAEADANCTIYNQMRSDNPGTPSCPYC